MNFFRVVLFHPSTMFWFGRYDLFIYRMTLLWLNLYAVISNQIKQRSHLEKLVVWVLGIISRIIIIYVEKISQCFISFQCHSHGNLFISKLGRPVHFDNSHSHLDTKEHLNFFSICFYWLSTLLKYCNGVISAAFPGGGINSFLLNEVSKTIGSFFLHL